jgi:hypothetical protein
MRKVILAVLVAFAAAAPLGCAGGGGAPGGGNVVQLPPYQDFPAPYEAVKASAMSAAGRLEIDIQGTDESPERFRIRFERSVGTLSRGEVGEIAVFRVDDQTTRVLLTVYRRGNAQIVAISDEKFTQRLFTTINLALSQYGS